MTRAAAGVVAVALLASGCAPDPPSSVVGIRVVGCSAHAEIGSGTFVAVEGMDDPLVLTSAHVVAGAREITVTRGDVSGSGRVVAFDPDMDLAYLAIDGLDAPFPWTVDSSAIGGGERGVVYVVRDGDVVVLPATVRRRVRIRTEDVYVGGEAIRPGYELGIGIDDGDSGGAVVVDGNVVGVVWARSRRDADRAYAIDPVRAGGLVREQLRSGDVGTVDPTRCP